MDNYNGIFSICALAVNNVLARMTGSEIRDEVSAWVTLIGSIAITATTIGIQVYQLIRDRDKKKTEDEKDGEIH